MRYYININIPSHLLVIIICLLIARSDGDFGDHEPELDEMNLAQPHELHDQLQELDDEPQDLDDLHQPEDTTSNI